jgi:ribosomal protein S8E
MINIKRSNRKNKKFMVNINGKTIHFGAKGFRIKPSTKSGDNFCARSYAIKDKDGNFTRNNKLSANYWSRKIWRCKGKRSLK